MRLPQFPGTSPREFVRADKGHDHDNIVFAVCHEDKRTRAQEHKRTRAQEHTNSLPGYSKKARARNGSTMLEPKITCTH